MIKNELRKLRNLNATPKMITLARDNKMLVTDRRWDGTPYKRIERKYACFLRCQNLNGYLKVAIFLSKDLEAGIKTPRYELFINPAGSEWITRELDDKGMEVRWLTAMIINLPDVRIGLYNKSYNQAFVNKDGKESINRLLKNAGNKDKLIEYKGACKIYKWQEMINESKIRQKEAAEQAPWDADMSLMPPIPPSFMKWMKKKVPETTHIFYEYQRGGAKRGYCQRCEREVVLQRIPHHRDEIKCPRCKCNSVLISTGKIKTIRMYDRYKGQLVQTIPGGFVIRSFLVDYTVETDDFRNTKYDIREDSRALIRGKKITYYVYTMYKNKYMRWCQFEPNYRYIRGGKIYKTNLSRIRSALGKQTALPILIQKEKKFEIEQYIYEENRHPVIEMLVKAGMEDMALDYVRFGIDTETLDEKQTELAKILRLDRERLRRLKKIGASYETLCWLQEEKEDDTLWQDDMIKYFATDDIVIEDVEFILDKLSLTKIYHYLQKQEKIACTEPKSLINTWRDYLGMAARLKMNTELELIYKPKNLKAAHDEAIELLQREGMIKIAKETTKKFPKVDKVCETLKKYEYSNGQFCIRAPKGIMDIVREGMILRHCIHTCDYYFDRISNRESFLLFLRRTGQEDTPWYTLEVEPGGNIRQKRTTGDDQKPDLNEAIPFLRKWQQFIKKQMDAEEKELAKVADKKRRENLDDLRKNGNRIWHGRLQGQLLADVLEQDFMSVI